MSSASLVLTLWVAIDSSLICVLFVSQEAADDFAGGQGQNSLMYLYFGNRTTPKSLIPEP